MSVFGGLHVLRLMTMCRLSDWDGEEGRKRVKSRTNLPIPATGQSSMIPSTLRFPLQIRGRRSSCRWRTLAQTLST